MIELRNLSAGYRGVPVIRDVSLSFVPGEILVLAGPNGCGKSTLLRTAIGLQPKSGGRVLLDGHDIETLSPRQVAQKAAFMAQSRNVPHITAGRMVLHGRFPYLTYPRRYGNQDRMLALRALEQAGALDLKDRLLEELSGGQRQKVYLAMTLAQDTQTVLMDEPTTYLDIRHQIEVMSLARRLAAAGKAVVVVLHDLCLAMRTADRIALLSGGLLDCGTPEEILRNGKLETVFGVALGCVQTDEGCQYYYRTPGKEGP